MSKTKGIPTEFDVFVSYSSNEKAVADAVVAAVETAGKRCWYAPRDIAPGADWADSITQAIGDCSLMVLIFSESANRSQRVIDEVNYAIDQDKPILPFRIEAMDPSGALSLHLSSRHWLDAYEPGWESHIERLVNSIKVNLENDTGIVQISAKEDPSRGGITPSRKAKKANPVKMGLAVGILLVILAILSFFGREMIGSWISPETSPVPPMATPTQPSVLPTQQEISPYPASLRGPITGNQFQLDPQDDGASMLTLSLFLTLTGYDFATSEVVPRAAESWTVSPDGMIYTFKIRSDIPWVQHELGGETIQLTDENGQPRFLKADEFEYALKRSCDPNFVQEGMFYGSAFIKGCQEVLEYEDPENIPPELFDAIGVKAVSDTELVITLSESYSPFLITTSRYYATAVPYWAIEKYGEAWKNPGLIPTNGLFVLDDWVLGESLRLVRNDLLPADMGGNGNVGTVDLVMADGEGDAYDLWIEGKVDYAVVPDSDTLNHLERFPDQIGQLVNPYVLAVYYNVEYPLYSNVHFRRALAAGFNRAEFIQDVLQGLAIPMIHFAPPGVFGAPPVDEIGVGDDLDYALAELELAGYPNCQGLPEINIYASRIDFVADDFTRYWEQGLGCPEGTLNYGGFFWDHQDEVKASDLLILGFVSEYPDEDGWLGFLYCEDAMLPRPCEEADDLILQARTEISPTARKELYSQIEEKFFGPDGSFPVVPIYTPISLIAKPDWFEYVQSDYFGYDDFSGFSVDIEAKQSALDE